MNNFKYIIAACLFSFGTIAAHVTLENPKGGETFTFGETVYIHWSVIVPHSYENWDLYFSTDGGTSWESITLDLPVQQLTYEWTVPEIETQRARIKVIMDNTTLDYEDVSENFTIQDMPTSVDITEKVPGSYKLYQNYPNPFNPSTTIKYSIPAVSPLLGGSGLQTTLRVYDILGNEIETLVNETKAPGMYEAVFGVGTTHHGGQAHEFSLPSGVYFYGLTVGNYSAIKKMILLK